jgi:hypothetical protein
MFSTSIGGDGPPDLCAPLLPRLAAPLADYEPIDDPSPVAASSPADALAASLPFARSD